ncbi:hypothetical protein [Ruania zhangjianzhongii]|uniref:hypothetical protein n=1 Tax=Ruania zhangjianzhongii TaxID=2603206 RepID=UPI0011CC0951|nr:hypothetical protein [Ruania zhangjianzhongii]
MGDRTPRHLLAPTVGAGVFMALYLLLRPYGDAGSTAEAAQAFGSTRWVVAHLCGALAIASIGRLGLRLADLYQSRPARLARWTGLAGAVLALPYYGAEAFGLHAIGSRALIEPAAFDLVDQVRNQPIALTMFALGLVFLAVAGVSCALAFSRAQPGGRGRAVWPLGVLIALLAPQFYLPPVGRVAYGALFLIAAAVLVVELARAERSATTRVPARVAG